MAERKKIAVIDGNSWTHRAYHAVPPVMKLSDGTPTNAVHGFMNMFLSFYSKAQPDAVICAFDAGIPKFRLEALQQYKAQRKPMDNELRVQFPIVEELLGAMDIPVVKVNGWEGDDILGTIAKKCEDLNYESLLITGDKDVNQLASNLTKIVNMKKGVSEVILYGPEEVYEKYGVKVDQFIDFLALMGDSSDNIPGVPGIGPKSAATLLQKFNSIEGIYENINQLKGKQKENIENNKEAAFISRKAATICRDVNVDIDLKNIYFPSFNKDNVSEIFLKYQMKSSLTGVLNLIGESVDENIQANNHGDSNNNNTSNQDFINIDDANADSKVILKIDYKNYISDKEAIKFVNNTFNDSVDVAVAMSYKMDETPAQTSLFDVADEEKYKYPKYKNLILALSANDKTAILEADDAIETLKKCAKYKHRLIFENAKDALEILFDAKSFSETLITGEELNNITFDDISMGAYLLNSSKTEYTAVDAYQQVFGIMLETLDANIDNNIKKSDVIYAERKNNNLRLRLARRSKISLLLKVYIDKLLKKNNLFEIYKDIEIPLIKVLVNMQYTGVKIDTQSLFDLSETTTNLLETLKTEILNLAGEDFNIDSPKQLGHILFEVLELPAKKKTKTGYSTAVDVLQDLSNYHPLPKKIIQYREYAKLKSTYIDTLPKLTDNNYLIHTSFHQKVTTTGRLSSSNPNLQNIPTRSEFGNKIRNCFIPLNSNDMFMTADYSQIELRVLAHLSKDKGLIDAFKSGQDFHAYTAANIYGVSVDSVDANMRRTAKAVNFGIVYGQQAFGLSQTLGISVSEAKEMIDKYFLTFPDVSKYLDEVVAYAKTYGYAETMFGRRRYIPELSGNNKRFIAFGQRIAMNHPMQGTAADIIKIAMIDVCREMQIKKLKSKCVLQVHDELDFSVNKGEIDILSSLVKDKMENAVELDVPLVVDIAIGPTWASAK